MKLKLAKAGLFLWLIFMIGGFIGINRAVEVDFPSLVQVVGEQMDLSDMKQVDGRVFKKLYGLDENDYLNCVLYVSQNNMDVKELLLMELKTDDQEQQTENAVQKRVENQKNSFEGYGIEQTKLISDHIMKTEGNYVMFVIAENAEAVRDAFYRALRAK